MIKQYLAFSEIPGDARNRYGAIIEDIDRFLHKGFDACEIDVTPFKDARCAQSAYHNAIRRRGVEDQVFPRVRTGRLFLVRKEAVEKC